MIIFLFLTIMIVLVVLIFIVLLKSNKNDKDFLETLPFHSIETGHITYNSITHKFAIYSKTSCIKQDILINEMENNIHQNYINSWQNWFSNARAKKLDKNNFIILKMRLPSDKKWRDFKISFIENRKNIYCFSMKDASLIKDNLETIKMYSINNDFNDFKSEVELLNRGSNKKETGSLVYINVTHFGHIYERYGVEIAKAVIYKLKSRIIKDVHRKILAVNFSNDNFVLFVPNLIGVSETRSFILNLNSLLNREIEVENYKLELNFSYGISIYNKFSTDFNIILNQAILAEKHAKKIVKDVKYLTYDETFENDVRIIEACNNEVNKVIYDNEVNVLYTPYVDLKKNIIWGYQVKYTPMNRKKFLAVPDVHKQAVLLGVNDQWQNNIFKKYLSHYLKRSISKRHKLILRLNPEDVIIFQDLYFSDPSFSEMKIIVAVDLRNGTNVLKQYSAFIEVLKKLSEDGVEIGIVVNETILKEYHQIFEIIDYVILDIDITYNVSNQQFDNLRLNAIMEKFKNYKVHFIMRNVSSTAQVLKLQESKILIASGPYFGNPSGLPSDLENKIINKLEELE